jgi:hypothetical protein
MLGKTRRGDFLFIYYTGHGYKDEDTGEAYLASYDAGDPGIPGWHVASIPESIERRFKGDRAFLVLDNCYSGALVESVRARARRVSYAVLTSASSNQVSTAEWTFTEILLAALRGRAYADRNGDGQITLGELAVEAADDMAFAERQRSSFTVTGGFSPQTVLALAERKRDPRIGERVVVRSEGSWYKGRIIDVSPQKQQFLIHYYGYDEWVSARRIRQHRSQTAWAEPR